MYRNAYWLNLFVVSFIELWVCYNVTWLRNDRFGFQFWSSLFSSLENGIIRKSMYLLDEEEEQGVKKLYLL